MTLLVAGGRHSTVTSTAGARAIAHSCMRGGRVSTRPRPTRPLSAARELDGQHRGGRARAAVRRLCATAATLPQRPRQPSALPLAPNATWPRCPGRTRARTPRRARAHRLAASLGLLARPAPTHLPPPATARDVSARRYPPLTSAHTHAHTHYGKGAHATLAHAGRRAQAPKMCAPCVSRLRYERPAPKGPPRGRYDLGTISVRSRRDLGTISPRA